MSSDQPYLQVRNLTKRFGIFEALTNINLDVNQSEFICLLGPSGCGKTTVLRCIAGLETPSSGEIIQDGVDVAPFPPDKRDFGIVFQSYALFPNLTVDENLGFGLKNRKLSKAEISKRIAKLTQTVGLEGHGSKFPGQLSGGQQQRVALARALATSPGLLLLDEPLSALDAKVRQHLRREILDLQRKIGITTILVTHDQEEALTMGDRIVVMDHGVIAQTGTPHEIYSFPKTPFVADFIGEMNFLQSTVADGNEVVVNHLRFKFGQASNSRASGDRVFLCIRPEDVVLRSNKEHAIDSNFAVAVVLDTEFLGSFYRVRLALKDTDNTEFVAEVPPGDMRSLNLERGLALQVNFPIDRLHIYPR